ncbi:MAG: hypothetical protein R2716_14240 [Microthrixaceae bacterium]
MLVTTLTKKMAEDLTEYLLEMGVRVRYPHSEVDTLERTSWCATCASGVRRVGRHQLASRGSRHPRGLARCDPRRRQGGLPALGAFAHPG